MLAKSLQRARLPLSCCSLSKRQKLVASLRSLPKGHAQRVRFLVAYSPNAQVTLLLSLTSVSVLRVILYFTAV